ncbi:ParB/RepB/Spo0J family partition protein [Streptomyces sp. NPDC041068]|uniref:ParB/RepB/Spo0J family partition protein n=1 Tax=Streptomyces sp. NPDC041068 TaxID=3155130 RepID=UPI0033F3149F
MTATKSTEPDVTQSAVGIEGFAGAFAWIDPRTLVIDPYNHRKSPTASADSDRGPEDGEEAEPGPDVVDTTVPDAELIASVEEIGVQTPLLLRPQEDGVTLGVIFGQRRCKAAVLAAEKAISKGRPFRMVPAIIRTDLAGVDDDALTLSLIENKHRTAASARDDLAAVRQLSLMNISKTRKAKHTRALGLTAKQVKAAEKADQLSDPVLDRALTYDFDFVEMADLHEVEELEYAIDWLRHAKRRDIEEGSGQRGHWAHEMQELRARKADRAARTKLREELKAAGVPLVDYCWDWTRTPARPLTDLVTADGTALDAEEHATCPGHAAFLDRDEPVTVWVCQDWKKCGHQLSPKAPKDARENKSREQEKEERRTVIANNKAWRAARPVRHEFLARLCTKKGHASSATWSMTLSTLTGTMYLFEHFIETHDTELMASFLRVPDPNAQRSSKWNRVKAPFADVIAATPAARRWQILLALTCAAYEQQAMGDSAWRGEPSTETTEWLAFLKTEGYALSDIEAETLARGEEQAKQRAEALAAQGDERAQDEEAEPVAA